MIKIKFNKNWIPLYSIVKFSGIVNPYTSYRWGFLEVNVHD
jgi:hypothetical protein